jgi:hemerythrin-like domain-containing protein
MSSAAVDIILREHAAMRSVLQGMLRLLDEGPEDTPLRFFDCMRAMLFYIDEFPERLHHPHESKLLFPKLVRAEPRLEAVVRRLDADHAQGTSRVRELQHLLLAWELIGDIRRPDFIEACRSYIGFYREHMQTEESQLLPVALRVLTPQDWAEFELAIGKERDPLSQPRPVNYDRLLARIMLAPGMRASSGLVASSAG